MVASWFFAFYLKKSVKNNGHKENVKGAGGQRRGGGHVLLLVLSEMAPLPLLAHLHPCVRSCLGRPDATSTDAEDEDAEPRKKGSEAEGLHLMSLPRSLC